VISALQRRLRDGRNDDGFTLIELMVVVMIIAILVAIAIPSFFGARKRAQDSSAKSSLQVSVTDANAIYSDALSFPSTLATDLAAEEPNISYAATASTGPKVLSVATGIATGSTSTTDDQVIFAAKSASGKCFYLRHVATPGLGTSGTYIASQATSATVTCTAADTGMTWAKQ
jgi:type IV pilus assembly protein PilA